MSNYRNILVLHSFHYPGRRRDGTVFYEKYSREVGNELGKLRMPYLAVIESPKKRNYTRLTERYQAKWILDLHNDANPYDPEIKHLLAMLYVSTRYPPNEDKKRNRLITRWIRNSYQLSKSGVYPVSIINRALYYKPPNYLGVELYSHNHVRKSVEFIKKLSEFLYRCNI